MTEMNDMLQFGQIDVTVVLKGFPADMHMHIYEFFISSLLFPILLPLSSQQEKD